jgi:hypothetical protein
MAGIQYVIEQKVGGDWHPIADRFEAPSAERAVARCARGHGHRRVRPLDDHRYEYYWVPPWGLPERIA